MKVSLDRKVNGIKKNKREYMVITKKKHEETVSTSKHEIRKIEPGEQITIKLSRYHLDRVN